MEWISVEDRFPKVGECATVLREGCGLESFDAYLVNADNWWTTKGAGGFVFTDVTHWAPIEPEEPAPDGWISVEDRLPEASFAVIACRQGQWDSYEAVRGLTGWFHCGCLMDPPPTHWMPMPDPPKALPLFYAEDSREFGKVVYLRGYGRICILTGNAKAKAQGLCDKLNHAWDLDLDKGSNDE